MKVIFACTLFFSLLFSAACERVVTPDEYFAIAQRVAAKIQREADERIRREAAGEPDITYSPEQLRNAEGDVAALADNLKRASDGGHTLATYFLANLQDNPMFSERTRKETCGLYQKAMDQGLLAAAIGYYHLCDKAYERFELHNADHLKLLQSLEQMLRKPDVHSDAYPLAAKHSLCFLDDAEPLPQQGRMAAIRARAVALVLTEEQYRAEANYILALTRVNANDRPDSQNIVYLDEAEALGCNDFHGLSAMMRNAVNASSKQ
ncbi:hypothetical protein BK666_11760 [Pseudomonas frederiksbergensis]|uniref:Lipoprotein n=1 Tax=Pseudomonas frederiksbergensis TaxID=104087 RepID=A0A423K776_9PSED|nr:hypothetical protein [Pseudomonas frederiksbergensis]RON47505.1 hypothetical protein BK666_11760 [Pseudomonas frederiksbergensis]